MDADAQRELLQTLAARRSGQLVHVELAGRDLSGIQVVGGDLAFANLARATLTDASLPGARLTRANLEGADLRNCDLGGADLTEANLRFANLTGARLDDTVLAGADLRDACLQDVEGEPLSMSGARLNKSAIERSGLKMRDIAQLVVRGAVVNEAESLAPPLPSVPAGGLGVLLALPNGEPSIVPSMREKEIESRRQMADLDDEVPASLRFMQRMSALIVEARPSLMPRGATLQSSTQQSTAKPETVPPMSMPKPGDEVLGAVVGERLPGSTAKRTFRGTMADGERVLLKVFDPEAEGAALQLPAFQRGLRALCRVQGALMPDGSPIRVAELLTVAPDLTAYVVRDYENGAISNIVEVAITMQAGLEMFRSVCETVGALHREGLLVRSFKPNNILIDGLTPVIGEIDMIDLPALVEVGGDLCGYGSYVAPEELIGQGVRSPTGDIYALGKLVDYLLTGHEPLAPVGSPPLIASRKGTPAALISIVKRCLSQDPADRYQYVEDLLEDLERFESRGSVATLQVSIRPGALSRLKTSPSLAPIAPARKSGGDARKSGGDARKSSAEIVIPQSAWQTQESASAPPHVLSSFVQRGVGFLGLLLGALGLAAFYFRPLPVAKMEIAQIALAVVLGLTVWLLPGPSKRLWPFRLGTWAAVAAVVYLAQPIQLSRLHWQEALRSGSLREKASAVASLARLGQRNFSGAQLQGVDLSRTDLGGASFRKAKLSGADLTRTFLAEADFTDADLANAKISAADLRGAQLEAARGLGRASCDAGTRFPDWLRCKDGRPRMQGPRPSVNDPAAQSRAP